MARPAQRRAKGSKRLLDESHTSNNDHILRPRRLRQPSQLSSSSVPADSGVVCESTGNGTSSTTTSSFPVTNVAAGSSVVDKFQVAASSFGSTCNSSSIAEHIHLYSTSAAGQDPAGGFASCRLTAPIESTGTSSVPASKHPTEVSNVVLPIGSVSLHSVITTATSSVPQLVVVGEAHEVGLPNHEAATDSAVAAATPSPSSTILCNDVSDVVFPNAGSTSASAIATDTSSVPQLVLGVATATSSPPSTVLDSEVSDVVLPNASMLVDSAIITATSSVPKLVSGGEVYEAGVPNHVAAVDSTAVTATSSCPSTVAVAKVGTVGATGTSYVPAPEVGIHAPKSVLPNGATAIDSTSSAVISSIGGAIDSRNGNATVHDVYCGLPPFLVDRLGGTVTQLPNFTNGRTLAASQSDVSQGALSLPNPPYNVTTVDDSYHLAPVGAGTVTGASLPSDAINLTPFDDSMVGDALIFDLINSYRHHGFPNTRFGHSVAASSCPASELYPDGNATDLQPTVYQPNVGKRSVKVVDYRELDEDDDDDSPTRLPDDDDYNGEEQGCWTDDHADSTSLLVNFILFYFYLCL